MPKLFDVNDPTVQIDILRRFLREWYSMHGPVPPELAEDHDMGWAQREADRLAAEADAAELRAKALKDFEARRQGELVIKSAAEQADEAAKSARAAADEARAAASSVSMQKWGEGMPNKGASNRDPNAPRDKPTDPPPPDKPNGKPDLKPVS